MENKEMNISEMEEVVGGKGGSPTKLPPKMGCDVYKIKSGDNLTKIARHYHTTAANLKAMNPTIHNINDITAGYYIYVPFI